MSNEMSDPPTQGLAALQKQLAATTMTSAVKPEPLRMSEDLALTGDKPMDAKKFQQDRIDSLLGEQVVAANHEKVKPIPINKKTLKGPVQQRLAKLDKEWTADEKGRYAEGSRLHDKNLRMVVPYLHKRGMWRVLLNEVSEIIEVGKAKVAGSYPGSFTFTVSGKGDPPKVGSLEQLSKTQLPYAQTIVVDMGKLTVAQELAYNQPGRGDGGKVDTAIREHIEGMTQKYGVLPPAKSGWTLPPRLPATEKGANERAPCAIAPPEPDSSDATVDKLVKDAEKRRAKKLRQKERRRLEQSLEDLAAAAEGGGT